MYWLSPLTWIASGWCYSAVAMPAAAATPSASVMEVVPVTGKAAAAISSVSCRMANPAPALPPCTDPSNRTSSYIAGGC